jgi:hypothetical protein
MKANRTMPTEEYETIENDNSHKSNPEEMISTSWQ